MSTIVPSASAAIPLTTIATSRYFPRHDSEADDVFTGATPYGSPTSLASTATASSHLTSSTVRLYHAQKVLGSDGSLTSNALSRSDSTELSESETPEEGTDAFYAQCHEQFGLPPFADIDILIFGYGSILWKQNFEFSQEHEVYIKDYKRVFFQSSTNHRGTEEFPGRCVTLVPNSYMDEAYQHLEGLSNEELAKVSSLVREEEGDKDAADSDARPADYDNRVYGKAYQLPSDPRKMYEIMKALDTREGGYDCVQAVIYKAHPDTAGAEEVINATTIRRPDGEDRKKEVVCLCYIATPESEDFVGDAPLHDMAEQLLDAVGFSGPNRDYLFLLEEKLREMGAHDAHVFALAEEARRIRAARERELQFYE